MALLPPGEVRSTERAFNPAFEEGRGGLHGYMPFAFISPTDYCPAGAGESQGGTPPQALL
jgi:hypothetical protein